MHGEERVSWIIWMKKLCDSEFKKSVEEKLYMGTEKLSLFEHEG